MPITAPTPDMLADRQRIRTMNENAAVADIIKSTLGPKGMTMKDPQTEAASLNAGYDLDDNADLIDENGALAVTLEDGGDALDCGVCHLPLRPPILQCINGHVMCSPCLDKLEATGNAKCHVCHEEIDSDDSRCHAMERVVESIRVPCPNAAHGCAARLTYYDRSSHRRACLHARYRCSGHGCGFVGSVGALLDHVASVHTNSSAMMQQFWRDELSSFMARLKLCLAAAKIRMAVDGHGRQG